MAPARRPRIPLALVQMVSTLGPFSDCLIIDPICFSDDRGSFLKPLYSPVLDNILIREQYITTSSAKVIRGMHFQVPPCQHYKIVSCITGSALDVVLDLRTSSPTFLKHQSIILSPNGPSVLIPPGFAHGFLSLQVDTRLLYNVSTSYSPIHDQGIHYNSFGFEWPVDKPIVSERDRVLPLLCHYHSPF